MVLLSLGVDVPESELRTRCDCTLLGTDALHAVDAVRQLGFAESGKYTFSLADLKDSIGFKKKKPRGTRGARGSAWLENGGHL
jgi:hypothetical protein